MSKKNIYLVIAVFIVGISLIFGTYAYLSWRSNNTTLNFVADPTLEKYINYDEGESQFSGDFKISSSYLQGVHTTLSISKTAEAANIPLLATIKMTVNEIGTNMSKYPGIKWVVTAGDYDSGGAILSQGNFLGVQANTDATALTLYSNINVTTSLQKFTVWIWADAAENPNAAMIQEKLDTSVWMEVIQSMESQTCAVTQISANNQIINATGVCPTTNIEYYKVTTSATAPTSGWVSIPNNDRGKIYNLVDSTTATTSGTYYAWFKDSTGYTFSKSVQVTVSDTTGPTCTWGDFNPGTVRNGQDSVVTITCTDTGVGFIDPNLTTSSFTTTGKVTLRTLEKETVTNGIKYTLTVRGTTNDGTETVTLPASTIVDRAGNNNIASSKTLIVANEYSITYKDCGDTTFSGTHANGYPQTYSFGTGATLDSPTKTGYTFAGYYTASACSGTAVTSIGTTEYGNKTFYAKWTAKSITVTANANGGSISSTTGWTGTGNTATKSVTFNSTYGTLPTATRTGYTLAGWNGKNLINLAVPSSTPSNVTYANTTPRTFTPNTYVNGLAFNNYYSPASVTSLNVTSTSIELTAISGYGVGFPILSSANKQYTLSFDSNGTTNRGFSLMYYDTSGNLLSYINSSILTTHVNKTFTTPSNTYYLVIDFYGSDANTNIVLTNIQLEEGGISTTYEPYFLQTGTTVTVPTNHNITAIWTPNTYTIAYTLNSGTAVTSCATGANPTTGTYGKDIRICNPTKTITFVGNANSTSGANAASGTVTIGSNTTKAQTFAGWTSTTMGSNAKTGNAANPSTAWNGSATTNTYFRNLRESGTITMVANWTAVAATLPTVERTGYTCGWNTSNSGTTITYASGGTYPTSAITNDNSTTVNLYAVCTPNTNTAYTVYHYTKNVGANTYTLNSTDNLTGTSDSSLTLANLKKTITGFTYASGSLSGGTSGPGTATTTTTISADGSRKIYLFYNRNSYALTLSNGTGVSATTGAGIYEFGASVAINATVKDGYTWSTWTKTEGTTPTTFTAGTKSQTIVMGAGAVTLRADATANTYTVTANANGGTIPSTTGWTGTGNTATKSVTYNGTYGTLPTPTRTGYNFKGWSTNLLGLVDANNYSEYHYNNNTTGEFKSDGSYGGLTNQKYYRVYGNSSNVDTAWDISTINSFSVSAGSTYTLSFYVRSANSTVTQYMSINTQWSTVITWNDGTKSYLNSEKSFANDGEWHLITDTFTVPSGVTSGTLKIGNDTPNVVGTNSYIDVGGVKFSKGNDSTPYFVTSSTIYSTPSNTTIYAMWEPNTYTISYTLNGGTAGSNAPTSGTYDKVVTISNPTRTGYSFAGWTSSTTNGTPQTGSTSSSLSTWTPSSSTTNQYFKNLRNDTGKVTMIAGWSELTATLTYNANNCGTAPSNVTMKYTTATNAATAMATLTAGYTFNGWNTEANGSGTSYAAGAQVKAANTVPSAITLYAQCTYTARPTITRTDYNTFSYSASSGSKYYVSAVDTSTAPTSGSTWVTTTSKDITEAGTYYVWAQDSRGNISPNYATIKAYTITRNATNTTLTTKLETCNGDTTTATVVLAGTPICATATPSAGYNTATVTVSPGTLTNNIVTINANTTITSSATLNKVTLTLQKGNSNTACTDCRGFTVHISTSSSNDTATWSETTGTTSTLTIRGAMDQSTTYYVWVGKDTYHPALTAYSGVSFTGAAAATGTIHFYTVTMSLTQTTMTFNGWSIANGGTVVALGTGTSSKIHSIVATPSTGYSFGSWSSSTTSSAIASTSSPSTTMNVGADTTLTATSADTTKPTCTITRTDYNTFSWTASDNVAVTGYMLSTTQTSKPAADATGWTTTGTLTSGTFDVTAAGIYYLWAKDAAGNVCDAGTNSITAYSMTRSATNATLTTRYDSTSSSTGTNYTTTPLVMLAGTNVWAKCEISTGYNTPVLKHGSSTSFLDTTTSPTLRSGYFSVAASEAITCTSTANTYTIEYTLNSGTAGTNAPTSGTYNQVVTISNPTRNGYTFAGWTSSTTKGTPQTGSSSNSLSTWSTPSTTKTTNEYFKNLRNDTGTVTMVANWKKKNYEISGTYYETLAEAMTAVQSNQTIKALTSDGVETTTSSLSNTKTGVKLDLNGQTVSLGTYYIVNSGELDIYSSTSGGVLEGANVATAIGVITNQGTLTTNGTSSTNAITIRNTTTGSVIYNSASSTSLTLNTNTTLSLPNASTSTRYIINNYGIVTISGATLTAAGTSTYSVGVYNNDSSSRVIMSSGSITTPGNAIYNYNGTGTGSSAAVVVTGGTITSTDASGIYNRVAGEVIIGTNDGGTPSTTSPEINSNATSGTNYGIYMYSSSGILSFYDGKVTSTQGTAKTINRDNLTINTPAGYAVIKSTSNNIGIATLESGNYINTTTNKAFVKLAEAMTAVQSNQTIKALTSDGVETTTSSLSNTKTGVKLDLNGQTVSLGTYYIVNSGELDIYSSTSGGVLEGENTSNGVIYNNGTLTTNGTSSTNAITIRNTLTSSAYVIRNDSSRSITLNTNTTLSLPNASTSTRYIIYNNGIVTISGATLTAAGTSAFNHGVYNNESSSRVIMSSGSITTPGNAINNYNGTGTGSSAAVVVTGGTITSNYASGIYNRVAGEVIIGTDDGGTPSTTSPEINSNATSGTNYGIYMYSSSGILSFYDGKVTSTQGTEKTINRDNTTINTPVGYAVIKSTNNNIGIATLGPGNYKNTTTNKVFATLAEAFSAVASNQTIQALTSYGEESSFPTLANGKTGVKLDLNGQTVSLGINCINNLGELDIYNTSSTSAILEGSNNASNMGVINNQGTLTTNGTSSTNAITIRNTSTTRGNVINNYSSTKTFITLNTNTTLTFNNNATSTGNRYLVSNNGSLNINGATLTNTSCTSSYKYCYGVDNTNTYSYMTMSNGTINTYNTAISIGTTSATIAGGTVISSASTAISVSGGTLTLGTSDEGTPSTISPVISSTSTSSSNYGVYFQNGGYIEFFDGKVMSSAGTGHAIIGYNQEGYPIGYRMVTSLSGNIETAYLASQYTISYTCNGGTCNGPTTGNYNTIVTIPTPTKSGYAFTGWTATGLGSNAETGKTVGQLAAWDGSATINRYYKNLTNAENTVTLVANWGAVNYQNTDTGEYYSTLADAFSEASYDQTIKALTSNGVETKNPKASASVNLDLNGQTISLGNYYIYDTSLDIFNSSSNPGVIEGSNSSASSGVIVGGNVTLNEINNSNQITIRNLSSTTGNVLKVEDLSIYNNATITSQGTNVYGIKIYDGNHSSIINMYGGTINTISDAVHITRDSIDFYMYGGTITSENGDGIYSHESSYTSYLRIYDGTIIGKNGINAGECYLQLGQFENNENSSLSTFSSEPSLISPLIQSTATSGDYWGINTSGEEVVINFYDGKITSQIGNTIDVYYDEDGNGNVAIIDDIVYNSFDDIEYGVYESVTNGVTSAVLNPMYHIEYTDCDDNEFQYTNDLVNSLNTEPTNRYGGSHFPFSSDPYYYFSGHNKSLLYNNLLNNENEYKIVGYYTASACTGTSISNISSNESGDKTIYAKLAYANIEVTFDPNGGTTSYNNKYVVNGYPYGELPVPYKTGYDFVQWSKEQYPQVEYIQATGTQYINTGVYPNKNTGVETQFQYTDLTTQQALFGTDNASYIYMRFYINGGSKWAWSFNDGSGNWQATSVNASTSKLTLKFNRSSKVQILNTSNQVLSDQSINLNGSNVSKTANETLSIFSRNNGASMWSKAKLYYFKMYNGSTLVRDFIPAYSTIDGSIGLYDSANSVFYPNAGTGVFLKGNNTTNPYVSSSSLVANNANHTLYAEWTIHKTTVHYYQSDCSTSMGTSVHTYGTSGNLTNLSSLSNNTAPITGGTFIGWGKTCGYIPQSGDVAGTDYYTNGQVDTLINDGSVDSVNLYAIWANVPTDYSINLNITTDGFTSMTYEGNTYTSNQTVTCNRETTYNNEAPADTCSITLPTLTGGISGQNYWKYSSSRFNEDETININSTLNGGTFYAIAGLKTCTPVSLLRNTITTVTSGAGLYSGATNTLDANRLVFKGSAADTPNRLTFAGDTGYRILSFEADNTMKIIRQYRYNLRYDEHGNGNGGKDDGNITYSNSSIRDDLNTTFYNGLAQWGKDAVYQNHTFYAGQVKWEYNNLSTLAQLYALETSSSYYVTNSNVGLPQMTDYFMASANTNCKSTTEFCRASGTNCTNRYCNSDNWMNDDDSKRFWFINNYDLTQYYTYQWEMGTGGSRGVGYNVDLTTAKYVSPVMYVKANTLVYGSGTSADPYVIDPGRCSISTPNLTCTVSAISGYQESQTLTINTTLNGDTLDTTPYSWDNVNWSNTNTRTGIQSKGKYTAYVKNAGGGIASCYININTRQQYRSRWCKDEHKVFGPWYQSGYTCLSSEAELNAWTSGYNTRAYAEATYRTWYRDGTVASYCDSGYVGFSFARTVECDSNNDSSWENWSEWGNSTIEASNIRQVENRRVYYAE